MKRLLNFKFFVLHLTIMTKNNSRPNILQMPTYVRIFKLPFSVRITQEWKLELHFQVLGIKIENSMNCQLHNILRVFMIL